MFDTDIEFALRARQRSEAITAANGHSHTLRNAAGSLRLTGANLASIPGAAGPLAVLDAAIEQALQEIADLIRDPLDAAGIDGIRLPDWRPAWVGPQVAVPKNLQAAE